MSKPKKKELSTLAQTAMALDVELAQFEVLSETALRTSLDSERGLQRAAEATQEVAECQNRIASRLSEFMNSLTAARQQNERTANAVSERTQSIQARLGDLANLLDRFARIGQEAKEVSEMARSTPPEKGNVANVEPILDRLSGLVESTGALVQDARSAGFPDLVQKIDTLRQQIQSARNKVSLVAKRDSDSGEIARA